jgi:hypothetical protein
MENKSFFIRYQMNQPFKVETHFLGDANKQRQLHDVRDLIQAYFPSISDPSILAQYTLHQIQDGVESEALPPRLSITKITGGQYVDDPLVIKRRHANYSSTRASLSTKIKNEKLALAKDFLKSIQQEMEPIPNSGGMHILHNVVLLEGEDTGPLIVRKSTEPFWNAVLETFRETYVDGRSLYRVCVVGTPGIGKTTTTPILIRILLKRRKTVVYFIRRPEGEGYYFEFKPEEGQHNGNVINVNVYNESEKKEISSLQNVETYYIVDPSISKDSCDKGCTFKPKLIIVTSPDERHWGESSFGKSSHYFSGIFKYMPLWELNEIIYATPFLLSDDPDLLESQRVQEVTDKYRLFGGVPRLIFERKSNLEYDLNDQLDSINSLTVEQAKLSLEKAPQLVNNRQKNQPTSHVLHYNSTSDSLFDRCTTCVASDFVFEQICRKFLKYLWNTLVDDRSGKILVAHLRCLFCQPGKLIPFENRLCLGKRDSGYKNTNIDLKLGGCSGIRLSSDPIASALQDPMQIFYSNDTKFSLFDFCYTDSVRNTRKNQLVLVKATTSNEHNVKNKSLEELAAKVRTSNVRVLLCYAVPCDHFQNFVTNPRNPKKAFNYPFDIRHINILKPV